MTWGIVVLVVGVIVALVASELTQSFASDFEFAVYQGEDVLGGSELSFSEVLGQGKPVVQNFWAGLCPPCRAEMPGFQAVHNQYGEEFILLGLDVGRSKAATLPKRSEGKRIPVHRSGTSWRGYMSGKQRLFNSGARAELVATCHNHRIRISLDWLLILALGTAVLLASPLGVA